MGITALLKNLHLKATNKREKRVFSGDLSKTYQIVPRHQGYS